MATPTKPNSRLGTNVVKTFNDESFRAYVPPPLPPDPPLALQPLLPLLERANQALGRLDGLASILPDPSLFIYLYVRKEAVLSSQIEGTQSSFSDLMLFENPEAPSVPLEDVQEVSNYVAANLIPVRYSWGALKSISDDTKRLARYHQGLRKLSEQPGLAGLIYAKPQSKINDPAKLRLLIQMIDSEDWSTLEVDVKGEVDEGLLARNADDVRGGAGQYFTPRPVIRAIVEVMRPKPMMRISDPACGTGGFLLAAFEYG